MLIALKEPNMMEGALGLNLVLTFTKPKTSKRKYPSVRPDLDNYCKMICDSANGILYKDDAQICQINIMKCYGETDSIKLVIFQLE